MDKIYSWLEQQTWLDRFDKQIAMPPCDKTILCEASSHKRSCHGRTVNVRYYVRKIKEA